MATFTGTSGDDSIQGTGGNDTFDLSQGGEDTVDGGGGDDTFVMGAALDSGDQINGGKGFNTVVLDGDYTAGVTIGATTMSNIRMIELTAGNSYDLTFVHPPVGNVLNIDGGHLGTADSMSIDASNIGHVDLTLTGGAGNDTLIGGEGDDYFDLSKGGVDVVHAGAGDDRFFFGSAFSVEDQIDGGAGNETVEISGFYPGGLHFNDTTITNVETLELDKGNNYHLTLANGNVAAGATLTVDGGGGNDVIDGRAVQLGDLILYSGGTLLGGAGNDRFEGGDFESGGGGNDIFDAISSSTKIDGGAGYDQVDATYFADGVTVANLTHVEEIDLGLSAQDDNIILANNISPDNGVLLIKGYTGESTIDGSQITKFHLDIEATYVSGDTLTGGAKSDTLSGAQGYDTLIGGKGADTLTGGESTKFVGGAGSDTINANGSTDRIFYLSTHDSTRVQADLINGLDDTDQIYLKPIDANTTKVGNQTFHLVSALDGHAGELALSYDSSTNITTVVGDVNGDGKADLVIQISGDHADFTNFVL